MMKQQKFMCAVAALGLLVGSLQAAAPSPHFKVFLCFGQSNMSGGSGVSPDNISKTKHERVMTLSFSNCSAVSPSRTADQWYDAFEPLHCDDGVNSMGPAYAFGQMLADSLPNDTIGLIPMGLWGVSIEMFMKGKSNTSGNAPSGWGSNAWDKMLAKCKTAVKRGVFTGIILEQGESNSGKAEWPGQVKSIYDDLKAGIPFEKDVPLVAGELLQTSGACCAGHNVQVAKIPQTLPLGYVASSKDLTAGGTQTQYHFSQSGYRALGQRMAVEMLKGLRTTKVIPAPYKNDRVVTTAAIKSWKDGKAVYSLNGKLLATGVKSRSLLGMKTQPGKIYIVAQKAGSTNARLMIAQ